MIDWMHIEYLLNDLPDASRIEFYTATSIGVFLPIENWGFGKTADVRY